MIKISTSLVAFFLVFGSFGFSLQGQSTATQAEPNENNPEMRPASAKGIVNVRNGSVDATRASLSLNFPLSTRLPGTIPAGFDWRLNGWRGGMSRITAPFMAQTGITQFRPVIWPRMPHCGMEASRTLLPYPRSLSMTFLGDPLTFLPLSQPTDVNSWTPSRAVPRYGAYTLAEVQSWLLSLGVPVPGSGVAQFQVFSTSDGEAFLLLGLKTPVGTNDAGVAFEERNIVFRAVMRGNLAAWWALASNPTTTLTSRWGEKVAITESRSTTGAIYTATLTNLNNAAEWIKLECSLDRQDRMVAFNTPYKNEYGVMVVCQTTPIPGFTLPPYSGAGGKARIRVTNSLGLAETVAEGYYHAEADTQAYYDTNTQVYTGLFHDFFIPTRIQTGGRVTTFGWDASFDSVTTLTSASPGKSLQVVYPSGLTETFTSSLGSTVPIWSPEGWFSDPDDPGRFGFLRPTNATATQAHYFSDGLGGIVRIQRTGPDIPPVTTLITQVVPQVQSPSMTLIQPRHVTCVLTYPTLDVTPQSAFRGMRYVHCSGTGSIVEWGPGQYLLYSGVILQAQDVFGTGAPYSTSGGWSALAAGKDWEPQGYSISKVTTFDGWDLRNWYNPSANVDGFVSPMPTRTISYEPTGNVGGAVSRLTVQVTTAGDPTFPDSRDDWGPIRFDTLVLPPSSFPVFTANDAYPSYTVSSQLSAIAGSAQISKRGSARTFNHSLGVLQQASMTTTLSGASLSSLITPAPTSLDVEVTTQEFGDMGRVSAVTVARGGHSKRQEFSFSGSNPSPVMEKTFITSSDMTAPSFSGLVGTSLTPGDLAHHFWPSQQTDLLTGAVTRFDDRNAVGQVKVATDVATGIVNRTGYDELGRISSSQRDAIGAVGALQKTISYTEDDRTKTEALTVGGKAVPSTVTTYDSLGRVATVTSPDGSRVSYTYDAWGALVAKTPLLRKKEGWYGSYTYGRDPGTGRLLSVLDPQGGPLKDQSIEPAWGTLTDGSGESATGVVLKVKDDRGFTMAEVRDVWGNRIAMLDEAGHLTRFEYDPYGNLVKVRNKDQVRGYRYNPLGWLLSKDEPEDGHTEYGGYTALGLARLVVRKGRDGATSLRLETTVDGKHRVTRAQGKNASGQVMTDRSYLEYRDDFNVPTRLLEAQPNGSLVETYGYDDLGRPNAKTVSDGQQTFAVGRVMDAAGNVTQLTYPAGGGRDAQVQTFSYDDPLRLVRTYLDNSLRAFMVYGDGNATQVEDQLQYNNGVGTRQVWKKGELVTTEFSTADGVDQYSLVWTTGGLLQSRTLKSPLTNGEFWSDTFDYDGLQRLVHAKTFGLQKESAEQWFAYDRYGNRVISDFLYSAGPNGVVKTDELRAWQVSTSGAGNDLAAGMDGLTPGSYQGVSAGTKTGTIATGAHYDNWGRMTAVMAMPGVAESTTEWQYDPAGRIYAEGIGGRTTNFLLDSTGLRFKRISPEGNLQYTVYGFSREPLSVFEVKAVAVSAAAIRLAYTPGPDGITKTLRLGRVGGVPGSVSFTSFTNGDDGHYLGGWFKAPVGTNVMVQFAPGAMDQESPTYSLSGTGEWAPFYVGGPGEGGIYADSLDPFLGAVEPLTRQVTISNQGSADGDVFLASLCDTAGTSYSFESGLDPGWTVSGPRVDVVPAPQMGRGRISQAVPAFGAPVCSGWFKAATGTSFEVQMGYELPSGQGIGNSYRNSFPGNGSWQPFTWRLGSLTVPSSPAGSKNLRLTLLGPASKGSVLVDDVLLGSEGTGNVIRDGFEAGLRSVWTLWGSVAALAFGSADYTVNHASTLDNGVTWKGSNVYAFGTLICEEKADGTFYIQSDQVQSPSVMTRGDGHVEARSKNLPFGERFGQSGSKAFFRRYASHEDQEGSAVYMQSRTYLPVYGKFAQPDPLYDQKAYSKDSWNLYCYVTNNPVTRLDPTGEADPSKESATDNHRGQGEKLVDDAEEERWKQMTMAQKLAYFYLRSNGSCGSPEGIPALVEFLAAQTGDMTPDGRGGPLKTSGSAQGVAAINGVLGDIQGSGSAGADFMKRVENAPVPIDIIDAKSGVAKDGTTFKPADYGGGFTLGPNQTKSGHVEVYVDTSMWGKPGGLGSYKTTDGKTAYETPAGLVSHELGHGLLRANGDRTPQGPASENKAIRLTNPIRIDLGLKPQGFY